MMRGSDVSNSPHNTCAINHLLYPYIRFYTLQRIGGDDDDDEDENGSECSIATRRRARESEAEKERADTEKWCND